VCARASLTLTLIFPMPVKSMEANQSWLVGLLLNVTRYFQEQVDALRADQSVMFDVQSHNINVTVERAVRTFAIAMFFETTNYLYSVHEYVESYL